MPSERQATALILAVFVVEQVGLCLVLVRRGSVQSVPRIDTSLGLLRGRRGRSVGLLNRTQMARARMDVG
jgi:hypothetical protein